MEEIKRELVAAGVIGRIIDDFNPHIDVSVFFRDKHVTLGHQISFGDVRECPDRVILHYDPDRPDIIESFRNRTLITMIMTDVDAAGGVYLRWVATQFFTLGHYGESGLQETLVAYEPPRSMGSHMIVVTLFKANEHPNFMINSRENFSTRDFAIVNNDNEEQRTVNPAVIRSEKKMNPAVSGKGSKFLRAIQDYSR